MSKQTFRTDRFVIYGIREEFEKWYHSVPRLDEKIGIIIDPRVYDRVAYGRKVFSADILRSELLDDFYIVVFDENVEYVREVLGSEYGIEKKRIISANTWIAGLLEDGEVLIQPERVRIEASTLCQLNCLDCFMRKYNYGTLGTGTLKAMDFERFLITNPFIRRVELSNSGEPFLNPELCEILQLAYKMGVQVDFANGANFNTVSEEVLDAVVKYKVNSITVSIDGASNEIYSIYRRNGNYDTVISNIRKINELKKQYQSDKPRMKWQYILMQHNECDIGKAKEMAVSLDMEIEYKLDWGGHFMPKDPDKVASVTGLCFFNRQDQQKKTQKPYLSLCQQMVFSPQLNWDGRLLGCSSAFRDDWGINCFNDYNYSLDLTVNDELYKNAIISHLMGEEMLGEYPCTMCGTYINTRKGEYKRTI